jgi:quinol monooxygenase YgiN
MVVTVVAEMLAKPGREEALKSELLDMVEKTRTEEGCAQYDLHVALGEPGRFVFFENWASEEALKAHSESAHLKAFGVKAADLVAERRVLRYSRIA